MADTEKITTNLNVVDLGRIDLLVEQGFYSTRTDLIRTAIRNQLNNHQGEIQDNITRKSIVVGVVIYNAKSLEKVKQKNEILDIKVMGMLVLADDISTDLAKSTINSIKLFGVIRAPENLKGVIKDIRIY